MNLAIQMAALARLSSGAVRHWMQGRTPDSAYQSLVRLFCLTGGGFNDGLSRLVSMIHPPYEFDETEGVLGALSPQDLAGVTADLDRKGYHVFARRIPEVLVERLFEFATHHPCVRRGMAQQGVVVPTQLVERYEREVPTAVRYDFRMQDVIDNPDVQQLMADRSILAVAQSYLRCKPIVDVMTMWWHTAYSKEPDKEAAQFWHFDMDRIKWLKFFIYLTDVGPDNGPHSFVEGSHRRHGIPDALLVKGYSRLTDEEVEACYPRERFSEFTAPRGTVIAEDTRGLHKGKHVARGDRLVLQLQFSNSLFGGYYPPARFSSIGYAPLQDMLRRYPRLYRSYWN